jgi:IS5 family transposase
MKRGSGPLYMRREGRKHCVPTTKKWRSRRAKREWVSKEKRAREARSLDEMGGSRATSTDKVRHSQSSCARHWMMKFSSVLV